MSHLALYPSAVYAHMDDPISTDQIRNAVVDEHGHSFDRDELQKLYNFAKSKGAQLMCPYTNSPIDYQKVKPNIAFQNVISTLKKEDAVIVPRRVLEEHRRVLEEHNGPTRSEFQHAINEKAILERRFAESLIALDNALKGLSVNSNLVDQNKRLIADKDKQITRLEDDYKEATKEIRTLKTSLEEANRNYEVVKEQNALLKKQIDSLKTQNASLKDKADNVDSLIEKRLQNITIHDYLAAVPGWWQRGGHPA